MNKNIYKVYKHVLRQDGRVYIGQTCLSSLKKRSGSQGQRYKHCTRFYNAIQKYGWDAFDHIVIADNLTLEEANDLEAKLIIEYNSLGENGFNLSPGGRNHEWTIEQRKAMRLRNLGSKNPNFGKSRSEEIKKKISEANKKAQLGKKHTVETKEKMSKSHQKNIPIKCVETGVVYSCPSEAAKGIGKASSCGNHISEVCQGKRKSAYGFHWVYNKMKE